MKSVIISGGSGGIGQALARRFAEKGYGVLIGYRTGEDRATALAEALCRQGFDAHAVSCDVTNEADVRRMVSLCEYYYEGADVLINCAGVAEFAVFDTITKEMWDRMMAVNAGGAFLLSRAVLRAMRQKGGGRIINISSVWGVCGAANEVHYSAAKAAVIGLTRALAKEAATAKVTVNCIAPGLIDTEMNASLSPEDLGGVIEKTPLGRIGTPEDVAAAALFFASDEASFITGQTLCVDGGLIL